MYVTWLVDGSNSNQIHKDKPKSESVGQVKRARGGRGLYWMYFPDAMSSVQYGRHLKTGSKFVWLSPRIFMRSACSACALVGTTLAVVLPVEFCVIEWGITAQQFVSGFCALCVCILTFARSRWIDGFSPLQRNNNVNFTLVLWWKIFTIIVFTWKIYSPLPKCQV